ncbi:MAG: hypothetical protein HYX54_05695 [Chloroflexi bacterium]|nr:hypothetical protein [Chloroflexota bacterium]
MTDELELAYATDDLELAYATDDLEPASRSPLCPGDTLFPSWPIRVYS